MAKIEKINKDLVAKLTIFKEKVLKNYSYKEERKKTFWRDGIKAGWHSHYRLPSYTNELEMNQAGVAVREIGGEKVLVQLPYITMYLAGGSQSTLSFPTQMLLDSYLNEHFNDRKYLSIIYH